MSYHVNCLPPVRGVEVSLQSDLTYIIVMFFPMHILSRIEMKNTKKSKKRSQKLILL